uniref:VP2 n=1 Tax=Candidatus Kentrum sp. LPFa TaxID=2126335 RepID=A0A450W4T0_9GAMM|nr:MAG: hypothetical protein BECKLPF1236B_GA0070989_10297 [Candidatus Kentron sp. LPFa]
MSFLPAFLSTATATTATATTAAAGTAAATTAAAAAAPTFLGMGAGALNTLGLGLSVSGALLGGIGANRTAEYNANLAMMNGEQEGERARQEAERRRRLLKREMGTAIARYGASGVNLEGSPLEALEEITRIGEEDALSLEAGANISAWRGEANAANYRAQGTGQMTDAAIKAGSSFLTYGMNRIGQ